MNARIVENFSYAAFLSLDNGNSTGSGFALTMSDKNYIITARHVLYDDKDNLLCKSLLITSQHQLANSGEERTLVIDDISAIKIIKSSSSDIIAIDINDMDLIRLENEGEDIITIQKEEIDLFENIQVANSILVVGFPTSLYIEGMFFDINKPLLRKGIVAGINKNEKTFIIDSPVFFGNSGGPILEYKGGDEVKLIGIISRYVPFVTQWRNSRERAFIREDFSNSGYAICVPINEIMKLLV